MTFTDIISPCQMRLWFGLPARSDTGLGKFVQDIVTILVTIITTLRISVTRIFSTGSGLGSWPWLSWWPEFLTPAVCLAEITQAVSGRPEKYLTSMSKNIWHYVPDARHHVVGGQGLLLLAQEPLQNIFFINSSGNCWIKSVPLILFRWSHFVLSSVTLIIEVSWEVISENMIKDTDFIILQGL